MARAGYRQNLKVSADGSTFVFLGGLRSTRRSKNNKSTDTTEHTQAASGVVVDNSIGDTQDLTVSVECHLDDTDAGQLICTAAAQNDGYVYLQHMPVVGTGLPAEQCRFRVETADEDFPQHGVQLRTITFKPTGQQWAPIVQS